MAAKNCPYHRAFGQHIKSLRRARGWTQIELAERARLSPDTVRRIEGGDFSSSLDTLRKLCIGLGVSPATLFASFETGEDPEHAELAGALSRLTPEQQLKAVAVLRAAFG